jgi:hypothetical protein
MRRIGRLKKLEAVFGFRGNLSSPAPPPTLEMKLEATANWLRDVGSSAMGGMHTTELWPAVREFRAAKENGTRKSNHFLETVDQTGPNGVDSRKGSGSICM